MVSFDLNRAIEHKVGYRNKSDDAPQFHVFFLVSTKYPPKYHLLNASVCIYCKHGNEILMSFALLF